MTRLLHDAGIGVREELSWETPSVSRFFDRLPKRGRLAELIELHQQEKKVRTPQLDIERKSLGDRGSNASLNTQDQGTVIKLAFMAANSFSEPRIYMPRCALMSPKTNFSLDAGGLIDL